MRVINIIISTELTPVILTPISLFKTKMLRVTRAIDKPTDRAILSAIFICLKKTSVQAKPGRKNIKMIPRIPLMPGKDSSMEEINPKTSVIGISNPRLIPLYYTYAYIKNTRYNC